MFHLSRSDASPSRQPEKHTSRRRSLSSRVPSTSFESVANLPLLPRRAPLAPLDPQSTNAPLAVVDDQMSSASSSSSFLGYNPTDNSQDTDAASFGIGRPIVPRNAVDNLAGNLSSTSRRRSIPNHTTVSRPPLLQSLRPLPRRATHAPSSITSSRRGSLPTILHQQTVKTVSSLPAPPAHDNPHFVTAPDDIYSNLSTFTFGAALSNPPRRTEHISPFTVSNSGTADRTPRPSVSGSSTTSRNRTPRIQSKEVEEGSSVDEEDEEEAARQNRAKMRAIDDGTRRPSLPINAQSEPSGSASSPRPDTDSEVEPDSAMTYEDGEELDTDVEFDYRNLSRDDVSDNASLHTFGVGGDLPPGPLREERMSVVTSILSQDQDQEDDEEVDRVDAGASSPVTFARIHDSGGESSAASSLSSLPQSRRGSVPWNIPGAPGSLPRDREDSAMTIIPGRRMSRSLDDELGHHPPLPPLLQATSQPTTRSDWRNLEAQVQAHVQAQTDTQGVQDEAQEENTPDAVVNDTYEGFNLQYILGDGGRRSWSSGAPSYIAPGSDSRRPSMSVVAPWESHSVSSGRRSSTTTMSDDAFTSQLRKLDKGYTRRKEEWSFRKETADGQSPLNVTTSRSGRPAIHELWRHQYVGRFKVDKQWTEHPSKAPTQRINIRHITDPFSRGNTRGGPQSIIHRHSRAVAFSIFRKYGLFGRSHQPGGTSFHVRTSGTILLATMDVQAQFTSTRTTSQLNAHGLLADGSSSKASERDLGGRERPKEKEKAKKEEKAKEKGKSKTKFVGTSDTSSQTASVSSAGSSRTTTATSRTAVTEEDSPMKQRLPLGSSPSVPVSPTLASSSSPSTSYAPSVAATTFSVQNLTENHASASGSNPSTSSRDHLPSSITRMPTQGQGERMELDDDDALNHPRTSHAEAFATLDSGSIDYIRGRSDHHHVEHDHPGSGGGLMERLARAIRGSNVRVSSGKPSGPSPDVPFTPTLPPWVTLAPRSKQEERERVIQNLNESFKDVGLLPTFKTKGTERSKGKQPMKNNAGVNVFEEVPPDALHMLLPLWPCNTDEASTVPGEDPSKYILPVEERQYLIVYYVPFDERKDKKRKKGDTNKKRSRADSMTTSSTSTPKTKGIPKSAFRVCARLVSYNDFLGTGVRLPSEGLTITGSMADAMAELPPASIREKHPGDVVIGVCSGRDKDIEFIPEGLTCVGLATAVVEEVQPQQPPSPVHEEEMMDKFDPVHMLTPIGRAAVEMAWLGCLAITFSDVAPPPTK